MVNEPDYPRPLATVDVVPLALAGERLVIGTLTRDAEPERGRPALPGGFVRPQEDSDVEAAALRVLRQKADADPVHLEQLAVFSGLRRDPREWSLSVAFLCVLPPEAVAATQLDFAAHDGLDPLPFDHDHIVAETMARLRAKAGYSSLPLCLLAEPFTLPQAHDVFELTMGERLDRAAFRRKILDTGFLEETGETTRPVKGATRPAKLYRRTQTLRFTPRNFAGR